MPAPHEGKLLHESENSSYESEMLETRPEKDQMKFLGQPT